MMPVTPPDCVDVGKKCKYRSIYFPNKCLGVVLFKDISCPAQEKRKPSLPRPVLSNVVQAPSVEERLRKIENALTTIVPMVKMMHRKMFPNLYPDRGGI